MVVVVEPALLRDVNDAVVSVCDVPVVLLVLRSAGPQTVSQAVRSPMLVLLTVVLRSAGPHTVRLRIVILWPP